MSREGNAPGLARRGRRIVARIVIAARENHLAIGFVAAWLAANAIVFGQVLRVPDWLEVVLAMKTDPGRWGRFYQPFTQLVVFGVVAAMVVTNVTRRHRPERTSRLLASEARDHVVIVGYTHLGQRIHEAAAGAGCEVVVVDDDRERVSRLLVEEEPLVLACGRDAIDLDAAAIARARVVAITTDDIEVAAVAARTVRAKNPTCELVVRCPDDDVGEVLGRAYRARIVSTSKLFAQRIAGDAARKGVRRAVVLGEGNLGRRTVAALAARGIDVKLVPPTDDLAALAFASVALADLVVVTDDDLGKNLVRVDRLRDLAPHARIVCRVFHEEAAEVLGRPPFRCETISTSRYALDVLIRDGAFRSVGGRGLELGTRRQPGLRAAKV